jgi:hypothetical protein
MTAGNGTQATLEQRLGSVLAAANASTDELKLLITETEAAANLAESEAARLHAEALVLGCEDADVKEQQALAADLQVKRLDAVLPRLDERLRKEAENDYARRWRLKRDRAVAARDTMVSRLTTYREMAATMAMIFQEVRFCDEKIIEAVNQSRPASEAPLATCELHARSLAAFSRTSPSILEKVQLPSWEDSETNIWPPRPAVPMAVLVAQGMQASPDPRYSDKWYESQGDRRAEQEAEQQRTAEYYSRQERERQEREAREDALATAEKQRSGIT